MGEMITVKILRQLIKEWTLPDNMRISWNINDSEEVTNAKNKFREYLDDGWIAFSDEPRGRRQIFNFDLRLNKIVLVPPLGGG